jgi:hypothetical protein
MVIYNYQSPGDLIALSSSLRDLHLAHPGEFRTDIASSCDDIFENNPHITKLKWRKDKGKFIADEPDVEFIRAEYSGNYPASINRSNISPYHFINGFAQDLEQKLGVSIPITELKGDIYLSKEEKTWISRLEEEGIKDNFWIIVCGGKTDFTCKWYSPEFSQRIVDHFKGKLLFVQCGSSEHWHPRLKNVFDLVGKTKSFRQFIRLIYHADGVVCPTTAAMHLAAAVPMKPFDNLGRKKPKYRPCVVLAGGRESLRWEAYGSHSYLNTIGMLPCCAEGGCWRSRCQVVGDGDEKDKPKNLCENPVKVSPSLSIPKCMMMITPEEVIDKIEKYLWWMT